MTAQMQMRAHPGTDAEKIVDALRAEPGFISEGGAILDWPATSDAPYRGQWDEK